MNSAVAGQVTHPRLVSLAADPELVELRERPLSRFLRDCRPFSSIPPMETFMLMALMFFLLI